MVDDPINQVLHSLTLEETLQLTFDVKIYFGWRKQI